MALQWIRFMSLQVFPQDTSKSGIDLSNLHVIFSVRQGTAQTPRNCAIRVYNLSDETVSLITSDNTPATRVVLRAGYVENNASIFDGQITQTRSGHETPVDSFVDIFATSADIPYIYGAVNTSLAAGHTQTQYNRAVLSAISPYGVATSGNTEQHLNQQAMPRGRAIFGAARDHFRTIARTSGVSWNMSNDNQVQYTPVGGFQPDDTIILNSNTGLIGWPTQTLEGILARCLLNPAIRTDRRVQIDNKSVQRARFSQSYQDSAQYFPKITADGIYKVVYSDFHGDTHQTEWYTDFCCLGLGETGPLTGRALATVGG